MQNEKRNKAGSGSGQTILGARVVETSQNPSPPLQVGEGPAKKTFGMAGTYPHPKVKVQ
jgi:hypothetical protein